MSRSRRAAPLLALALVAGCARDPAGSDGQLPPGTACILIGIPSVLAEVRDGQGRPAARGATLVVRGQGFEARGYGSYDSLRIASGDPLNRGGNLEVRVTKPWYGEAVLKNVYSAVGPCGISQSKQVSVTITLLPGAPPVRQVVVPNYAYGFGDGNISAHVPAFVEADSGVSHEVAWVSRDTGVARITRAGDLTAVCRASAGSTYIVASSVADPAKRDSVRVEVWARQPGSGRCP